MTYRAAIVGCAATTALGADLDATWAALAAGRSALEPWPDPRGWDGRAPLVARIGDAREEPEDDPTLRILGRHGEWLDLCARRAHDEGRLKEIAREDVGLFVALGMVDSAPEELAPAVMASRGPDGTLDLVRFYEGGFRTVHPLWPLAMLGNVSVGQVAIELDLRGDNVVLAHEADAGARVIGEAWRALALGAGKAALVGGVAEPVCEASLARRDLLGALARGPGWKGAGWPAGEGAAVLALEDPASARARGADILGYVAGHGEAFGARNWERAAEAALASCGRAADDVDLVFWGMPQPEGPAAILRNPGAGGFLADWVSAKREPQFVSAVRWLGHVGPAAAALDVALALRSFGAGAPPAHAAVGLQVVDRPVPPRRRPERALVCAVSSEGTVGAVVVEAASCAS